MLIEPVEYEKWKENINDYEKNKKNINFVQEVPNIVTHKKIKLNESQFNTVLNKFKDENKEDFIKENLNKKYELKGKNLFDRNVKFNSGYDPITLKPNNLKEIKEEKIKTSLQPLYFSKYNIITNNKLPEYYFKNGNPIQPKIYKKNINKKVFRDYDIISNKYWKDNEMKFKEKYNKDKNLKKNQFDNERDFNLLTCSYYNNDKEIVYNNKLENKKKEHGKNYLDKLPPTLRIRETITFNNKQTNDEIKAFDEKKKNEKKRYELRYKIEDIYRDRNIINEENKKSTLKRFNINKYNEEKLKGYDNINLNVIDHKKNNKYALAVRKNDKVWNNIIKNKLNDNQENNIPVINNKFKQSSIKTGGFN